MFICNPRINAGGAFVDIFGHTHVQSNKNFESPDIRMSAEVEQAMVSSHFGSEAVNKWLFAVYLIPHYAPLCAFC